MTVMEKSRSQYIEHGAVGGFTAEKDKIKYEQARHLGAIYVPRKGKSREKYVDVMVSNLGNIFNMEDEKPKPQRKAIQIVN